MKNSFSLKGKNHRINFDDARKIITPNSSMMGRPDLQLQPMKVRTRKTRPERNRKDEILIISS